MSSKNTSKILYAKKISGLPTNISLTFDTVHINFYKSRQENGFFYCELVIPKLRDDDENILVLDFMNSYEKKCNVEEYENSEEEEYEDPFNYEYEVPLNDHNLDSLPDAIFCYFEYGIDRNQPFLLLHMKIKNTPFFGFVFIESNLYTIMPL